MVIENEAAEVRLAEAGEMTVAFVRLAQGTDLGPALIGLEGDEAFYWAPGHTPEALDDCAYVDFSPTEAFNRVIHHIQGD